MRSRLRLCTLHRRCRLLYRCLELLRSRDLGNFTGTLGLHRVLRSSGRRLSVLELLPRALVLATRLVMPFVVAVYCTRTVCIMVTDIVMVGAVTL